jgi:hypothetical protein
MKEWKMQETNRHDLRHDAVVVGGGSADDLEVEDGLLKRTDARERIE